MKSHSGRLLAATFTGLCQAHKPYLRPDTACSPSAPGEVGAAHAPRNYFSHTLEDGPRPDSAVVAWTRTTSVKSDSDPYEDEELAEADSNAISDVPLNGVGTVAFIGHGGGGGGAFGPGQLEKKERLIYLAPHPRGHGWNSGAAPAKRRWARSACRS